MRSLRRIKLSGFKSIREMDLTLRPLNVLIGANGAGKSNFLSFFTLLESWIFGRLDEYIIDQGGMDVLLHHGSGRTRQIDAELVVDTGDGLLMTRFSLSSEQKYSHEKDGIYLPWILFNHLFDRSQDSPPRQPGQASKTEFYYPDGSNTAAYLRMLQKEHAGHYVQIRDAVRMVAPFFDDFSLEPTRGGQILLEWKDRQTGSFFNARQLSDGTLSFICLATLLLQPSPPSLILIDEPELGLHPYALNLLSAMLKSAATRTQIIVSTQSVTLLDQFDDPEDVIVVDRQEDQSVFRHLDRQALSLWLEEYSLGELWQKNVLGGRP